MEIKTCEQYVVSRLMELENQTEELKEKCRIKDEIITDLREKLEFVGSLLQVNEAHDYTPENNRMYIETTVWNTYDKDKFEKLREILNLPLPGELEEEEE